MNATDYISGKFFSKKWKKESANTASSSPGSSVAISTMPATFAAVMVGLFTRTLPAPTLIYVFMPKYHWLPFFIWGKSASCLCPGFCVEGGAMFDASRRCWCDPRAVIAYKKPRLRALTL